MTEKAISGESLQRLSDIRDEIKDLVQEAFDIVRDEDAQTASHAKNSWYAHIICALDTNHSYLDRSDTIADTIRNLEKLEE